MSVSTKYSHLSATEAKAAMNAFIRHLGHQANPSEHILHWHMIHQMAKHP